MPEDRKIETLYTWKAPARPFVRRTPKWFLTVGLLVGMAVLIALLFQDWVPIGVLFSLLFVIYVLAAVPPEQVTHKITTQGITTTNHSYLWNELGAFWVSQQYGNPMIHVEVRRFAAPLLMLVESSDLEKVKALLVQYIPFREIPERTFLDRTAEWLGTFLPLEQGKK